jgi:hypothetical protein
MHGMHGGPGMHRFAMTHGVVGGPKFSHAAFPHRRFAHFRHFRHRNFPVFVAGVGLGYGLGYGYTDGCWQWVPGPYGWRLAWVCNYDYYY